MPEGYRRQLRNVRDGWKTDIALIVWNGWKADVEHVRAVA